MRKRDSVSNMSQSSPAQKVRTSQDNSSQVKEEGAFDLTSPLEFEYYSTPKNFTMRSSKRAHTPSTKIVSPTVTNLDKSYNQLENLFYRHIRIVNNQQAIHDEEQQKLRQKIKDMEEDAIKRQKRQEALREKAKKKAEKEQLHRKEIKERHEEISKSLMDAKKQRNIELKKDMEEFIKQREEFDKNRIESVQIPFDERCSYVRGQKKKQEILENISGSKQIGEQLVERLYNAEQRNQNNIKEKIDKMSQQSERVEKTYQESKRLDKLRQRNTISMLTESLLIQERNNSEACERSDKKKRARILSMSEKKQQLAENLQTLNTTFSDNLKNCSCSSKIKACHSQERSVISQFNSSKMSFLEEKMAQTQEKLKMYQSEREVKNEKILRKHHSMAVQLRSKKNNESVMNNFKRRALFLTKEEFKVHY